VHIQTEVAFLPVLLTHEILLSDDQFIVEPDDPGERGRGVREIKTPIRAGRQPWPSSHVNGYGWVA
jgi:hypothetical protein